MKKYSKAGQPKTFKTPAVFKKKVFEYLEHCSKNEEIPFIVGFSVYTRVPLSTVEGYSKYEGYTEVYELIKNASEHTILQQSLKKNFSDKISMFILTNHYDYVSDKPVETNAPQTAQTIEITLAEKPKKE